ncbi:lipase 1-like [Linepithema humile]|uniref:lipase 1-like n=1 Tax=Linepithema humile TaxID=83485 RepID=UPI000622FE77|nr:PREDICTED: lipase 1-like [Linepithema humile]
MMQPTAIVYFLTLCGFLSAATVNVTFNNLQELLSTALNDIENVDVNLNTLELIKKAGYPAEAHVVLTEDGYLLTIHRIPGAKNSPPVLVQHGILCSSADWVVIGKQRALAFILADQGYDVWLSNFRGNTYSKAHISLSPSDPKFWDFSFDEMGTYDLPAIISYITNLTSEPLHTYIGHSMGTTTFYVMAIKRPEVAKMVRVMISLAPVAFVRNLRSVAQIFLPFKNSIEAILYSLGVHDFIPLDGVFRNIARMGCNVNFFTKQICSTIIFLICGFDEEQLNDTLLPVILAHFPSSTSTKTLIHYGQEMISGKFCAYDYGREKNMQMYNATIPPDYDLSRITVPIALIYAYNDLLATEKDVKILRDLLTNIVDDYRLPSLKFNHIDYMWAQDARTLVYEKILEIMKKKVN